MPPPQVPAYWMPPKDLIIAGLDTNDKAHGLYDPRIHLPLAEEFIEGIMMFGIIQPVSVTLMGNLHYVIDGRQRVRGAREANKRLERDGKEHIKVPVVLKRGDSASLLGMSIVTNEHRVNDDPITQSSKCQRYLDLGRTEHQAAMAFGVSQQTIRNRLKLLQLDPRIQDAVKADEISATAAVQLADMSPDRQMEAFAAMKASGSYTVEQATVAAKRAKGISVSKKPSKKIVKAVLESGQVSDEFARGVQWAIGALSTDEIEGLAEVIGK